MSIGRSPCTHGLARMGIVGTSMATQPTMIALPSANALARKESQQVLSYCLQQKRQSRLLIVLTLTTVQQPPWMQQRQIAKQLSVERARKCRASRTIALLGRRWP